MNDARARHYWIASASPLLAHAVFGDQLGPPGQEEWFAAVGVARSARIMMLNYRSSGGAFDVCVAVRAGFSAEDVAQIREALTPQAAEARWGPFVGMLGRYAKLEAGAAPPFSDLEIMHANQVWRVRRARHPSAVIERLLDRDRAEAEERLQGMLSRADTNTDPEVGERPRVALRANVGDIRGE